MFVRLAYLAAANTFAVLRLLPMTGRGKESEIVELRWHRDLMAVCGVSLIIGSAVHRTLPARSRLQWTSGKCLS
ncbi:hypothetical protein ABZ914_30395 [Spirillospora sp. NPDC046719]